MTPGRSCPLAYRYAPAAFARPASLECETLFVVGGVYGNRPALRRIVELFDAEPGRKRLVFNGDFHWFDVDPAVYAEIGATVLAHEALRGNVETELAVEDADGADDAGCGCGYPEWVDDAVVAHSNAILRGLRATARQHPALTRAAAALPMTLRADVAGMRVAIVHGDATSLAGWGFAHERLADRSHAATVAGWFDAAQVDLFASSHTCLPVFQRFGNGLVLNNGAAGMANFSGHGEGLLTRISTRRFDGPQARYGTRRDRLFIDAIAVDFDAPAWQAEFLAQWPPGSSAHASYWRRIVDGPDHTLAQAMRLAAR
ncbi:MAG: hypothetical protein ABIO45_12390 [Burkholderiaceae bacterium]